MHRNRPFVYVLLLLTGLWIDPAAAQNYIDLGPPFVQLQPVAAPGLTAGDTHAGDRQPLQAQFAAGRYAEAAGTAKVLLAQAQQEFGEQDIHTVPALEDLGACQHYAGDAAGAARSYARAIGLLDATPNGRDPRLAWPLYGLGAAEYAQGNYAQAVEQLQKAVFITRVNQGLNSLAQLRFYDALTESYLAVGNYDAAKARQKVRIAIVARATGADSAESAGALQQAAQFYRRVDSFFEERDFRRRQLRLVEQSQGYDALALVPILLQLGASYRLGYYPDNLAISDLQRALQILDKHPEADTRAQKVAVLVELGDLYLTFRRASRAQRYYREAYQLLDHAGDQASIKALFSKPVPVFVPRPDALDGVGDAPAAGLPAGQVTLQFDLRSDGRPLDVSVVDLQPDSAEAMRARAQRSLRAARFRVPIGPQGPIKQTNVKYELKFNYVPTEG